MTIYNVFQECSQVNHFCRRQRAKQKYWKRNNLQVVEMVLFHFTLFFYRRGFLNNTSPNAFCKQTDRKKKNSIFTVVELSKPISQTIYSIFMHLFKFHLTTFLPCCQK